MAMDTQHDNITFPLPSSYQETFNKFAGVDKPRIYVPQLRAIRKRIRFTAEQLKILHSHFNIHSLPSQDEVTTMSKQTGLTERKIKNWFRNTLFKARQQDPNSPYNFSNVSSTDSNNQIRENQEKIEDSATCENPHDMETDNDKDSDKSGKDETNDVHDVAKTNMKIALVKAKMKMKLAKAKAKILCEFLERSTYPDDDVIERLAKELNVSYEAIKTWFQNNWHKNAIKNLDNQMQSPLVTSSSGSDKDEEQRESHSDNTIQNQPVVDTCLQEGLPTKLNSNEVENTTPTDMPTEAQDDQPPVSCENDHEKSRHSSATTLGQEANGERCRTESQDEVLSTHSDTEAESDGQSGATHRRRRRRKRTTFGSRQIDELEKVFQETPYPYIEAKEALAKKLGLSESNVQVWFQNRRAKWQRSQKPICQIVRVESLAERQRQIAIDNSPVISLLRNRLIERGVATTPLNRPIEPIGNGIMPSPILNCQIENGSIASPLMNQHIRNGGMASPLVNQQIGNGGMTSPLVHQQIGNGGMASPLVQQQIGNGSVTLPLNRLIGNGNVASPLPGQQIGNGGMTSPQVNHQIRNGSLASPLLNKHIGNGILISPMMNPQIENYRTTLSLLNRPIGNGNMASPLVNQHGSVASPLLNQQVENGTVVSPLLSQQGENSSNVSSLFNQQIGNVMNYSPLLNQLIENGKEASPLLNGQTQNGKEASPLLNGQTQNGKEASSLLQRQMPPDTYISNASPLLVELPPLIPPPCPPIVPLNSLRMQPGYTNATGPVGLDLNLDWIQSGDKSADLDLDLDWLTLQNDISSPGTPVHIPKVTVPVQEPEPETTPNTNTMNQAKGDFIDLHDLAKYSLQGKPKSGVHPKHVYYEYKCYKCEKTFGHKFVLMRHMRIQHTASLTLLSRETSLVKTNHRHDLMAHEDTTVDRTPVNSTYSKDQQKQDSSELWGKNADFTCYYCVRRFISKADLQNHIKDINKHQRKNKYNRYACYKCKKSFIAYGMFHRHMAKRPCGSMTGETKAVFPEVQLQLDQEGISTHQIKASKPSKAKRLAGHLCGYKSLSTDLFKCRHCDHTSTTKRGIQNHILWRHNCKKYANKPIACFRCPKRFLSLGNLQRHRINAHKGHSAHRCHICKKVFTSKWELKDHMSKHRSVKLLQCAVCLKRFRQKSALMSHIEMHIQKHEEFAFISAMIAQNSS